MLCRLTQSIEATLNRLGRVYTRLVEIAAGRRLYLVGGTIRDLMIDREPTDFDFAVSGSGLEFAKEFSRRVHGRLVVLSEPDDEARVVYRRKLVFDFNGFGERTIEHDLTRRDFTVNALACEIRDGRPGELVDIVHGQEDIRARVLRPVSDQALTLDPLRLLRALRLALELGFTVDESVYDQGRSTTLVNTAPERIGAELLRIMERPGSCTCIEKLYELGRLQEILPEFQPVLNDPQLRQHSLRTYCKIEEILAGGSSFSHFEPEWTAYFDRWGVKAEGPEPASTSQPKEDESETPAARPFRRALLKLAGLLHDIAKPQTRFTNTDGEVHFYGHDSLGARLVGGMARERLRLSRHQAAMVKTLVAEHMRLHLLATAKDLTDRAIRRFFHDLGDDAFGMMILNVADGWATAGRTLHLEDTIARMIGQKRDEDAKASIKRLVTGDDLIELGLKPGPSFKVILQELQDLQIEGRIATREEGLEYLKTHLAGLTAGSGKPTAKPDKPETGHSGIGA
jgi:poly(A) polymerase